MHSSLFLQTKVSLRDARMSEPGSVIWRLRGRRTARAECTVQSKVDGSCELKIVAGFSKCVERFATQEEAFARAIDVELRMVSQGWSNNRSNDSR